MITGGEVYRIIEAMVPLYVAIVLGYISLKWWRIFTPEMSVALNRLTCYVTFPLFLFEFISHTNPYKMNYRFIAADAVSKIIVLLVLAIWCIIRKNTNKNDTNSSCNYDINTNNEKNDDDDDDDSRRKNDGGSNETYGNSFFASFHFCWSITAFWMCTMSNTLIIGVPLMKAMYGQWAVDLVVQVTVTQFTVWFIAILFAYELRRDRIEVISTDMEANRMNETCVGEAGNSTPPPFLLHSMKKACLEIIVNPTFEACIIGLIWGLLSNRFHFQMPAIVEGSVQILSKATTGVAMFTMGLFMASQEKLLQCGAKITLLGMIFKFLVGPATMAVGGFIVGLRGHVLKVAIVQAALPLASTAFNFAKEYGFHTKELSAGIIFGTMASLPILIAYYVVMDSLH